MRLRIILLATSMLALSHNMYGQDIEKVSILEISSDYGIPAAFIRDTDQFINMITTQNDDLLSKASTCANFSARAQTMLISLKTDYPNRDGLVWLDDKRAIFDLNNYALKIQEFAVVASRYSQEFLQKERERKNDAKRKEQLLSADIEQQHNEIQRQKIKLLKDSINVIHDSLTQRCLYETAANPETVKERKDLYYAYLTIYNQLGSSTSQNADKTIYELRLLRNMQRDMLANAVSDTAYSIQIREFAPRLKAYAYPKSTDVYRSYLRHFSQGNVNVNFSSINGYNYYINRLRNILTTQNRYIQAIDIRDSIQKNSVIILQLYGRRYMEICNAYKEHLAATNLVPDFNTLEESAIFMDNLHEFVAMQQLYLNNHQRLEQLRQHDDSIMNNSPRSESAILSLYGKLPKVEALVPSFRTMNEYADYKRSIDEYEALQSSYTSILALRDTIKRNGDEMVSSPYAERVFVAGYKRIKKNTEPPSSLSNLEETEAYIHQLEDFIATQKLCEKVLKHCETISRNDKQIEQQSKRYSNINAIYEILRKDYEHSEQINNLDDMRQYFIRLMEFADIQGQIINILQSNQVGDIDNKLYNIRNVKQIKQLFHI